MSGCPGLHCPGCSGGETAAGAGLLVTIGTVVGFLTDILLAASSAVAVAFAVVIYGRVRAWRRGWRPSLDPVVA